VYDIFSKEIDTVEMFNAVTTNAIKLMKIAGHIDMKKTRELLVAKNPPKTIKYLY